MSEMPTLPTRWQRARPALACALVLAIAVGWLHREVLFGGDVYHMDDAADGYYPGHIAVARAFAHGELPTWERGSWCGWPLVVDPYNGVFYPLNVVYYLVGAARGLGYAVALHVWLGGMGMWLLLRRRRLTVEAALFGALAYALASFGVVRIRHVIFVQMMGWLPWILAGVEGWIATHRRRELVLVAAATGLALVAGALSIGHFAALVIAGYTIARCAGGGLRDGARDAGALVLAAAVGALCAAVQLAPTLAHLPLSPRALGSDYAFASSYAWPNARYLYTLFAPDVFGGEDRMRYFGAPNHWELCGWYVGALTVFAAPLALGKARGGRFRPELFVLGALVALAVLLALGDAAPVHRFFFRYVPLYASLRCPARALLMAVLALPILGAHGVQNLVDWAVRLPKPWLARAAAALLAVAGALIAWKLAHPPRGASPAAEAWLAAWSHLAWVAGGGAALAVAAFAGRLPPRAALAALAVLSSLDLLQIDRAYVLPQPPGYPAGMERFAAVEWLRAHGDGSRMVNDPEGPFRLHNVGMVLDLENASGYDSVATWRYVDFLYLMAHGHPYPEKKLRHDFAGIGVHNLQSRLLDLMNVKWVIAAHPPSPRFVERFRPEPPTGAPAAEFEPFWDPRLNVYENTGVLPRAFVAYRASVPGDDARLAARLTDGAFDPSREVLLEKPPPFPVERDLAMTPARITTAARHRLVIEADAQAPGMLFVGDAHYPGWRATVDGKPAELYRADWAFRAVAVPAGRHVVEMTYASRPVAVGAVLSLAGLLGLVALLGVGRRRVIMGS